MRRPLLTWAAFVACLLVVLGAMGWTSRAVIRLDRSEAKAREQAELEESVRLALWRMDSALTLVVAQESSRPFLAYGKAENGTGPAVPFEPSPHALIHFQLDPRGALTSPQVPAREPGRPEGGAADREGLLASRLGELRALAPPPLLTAAFAGEEPRPPAALSISEPAGAAAQAASRSQTLRNAVELQARATNVANLSQLSQAYAPPQASRPPAGQPEVGRMQPVWIGTALLLGRRISVDGESWVQGLWLDWPRLKSWLLSLTRDLLPGADLEAAAIESGEKESRRLAALPLVLRLGAPPAAGSYSVNAGRERSPLLLSLQVAWASFLLAAAAVAALLFGVMSLSERRAAFVSAVTHELRTPLTTFSMYTEMLREEMVGAEQRKAYLATLYTEARRLTHLVENVLSYARIENSRAGGRVEVVPLAGLLSRARGRLEERAAQAGLELVVEAPAGVLESPVEADAAAVEQVLFNLVDNACKYAARATDRRLHLEACTGKRVVALRLRDHGPGIPASEARRLFRPFSRSARDAAGSAPGVGLGLALSRRLARSMDGDLVLEPAAGGGAAFVLTLRAPPGPRC